MRALLTVLLIGVSAGNWALVLAAGLLLMWLWWAIDCGGVAAAKGRRADAWTGAALLSGPAAWLLVRALPAAGPPRAARAPRPEAVRRPPAPVGVPVPVYVRVRRWQAGE